ncbi:MAG: AHH domain-containing protein [Eubacteriales bacterium]|nr:AHH domain-containing protein [Eubacteriales bacterium]
MIGDSRTYYVTDGSKILYEYQQNYPSYTTTNQKYYYYDDNGYLIGFRYNGVDYYYGRNVQGDIIRIYDSTGTAIVYYSYDAWGNILTMTGSLASTVGTANPFRYRGYYYDSETGFYYLNSRYYDPQTGRFINADSILGANGDIQGYNLFAYCSNNPVNITDPSGEAGVFANRLRLESDGGVGGGVIIFLAFVVVNSFVKKTDTTVTTPMAPIYIVETMVKEAVKEKINEIASEKKDIIPPDAPRKHHIVAQNDYRAAESRQILRDVGIEPVTSLRNLVVLPQSYHVSLHTTAYHDYVTERLRLVAGDKDRVEATLDSLRAEILIRSSLGIRWD